MSRFEFFRELGATSVEIIYSITRILFINICNYYTIIKITNMNINRNIIKKFAIFICIFIETIIYYNIKVYLGELNAILILIILSTLIYCSITKKQLVQSILGIVISVAINYSINILSILISFFVCVFMNIRQDVINLIIICTIHLILLVLLLRIKKLKYGLSFFGNEESNEYIMILILNISATVLFVITILMELSREFIISMVFETIIMLEIMFVTVQKSLQLYYKQKLLAKELEETKKELEDARKEITELEKENLEFSKTSHTIAHKQRLLQRKLNNLMEKDKEKLQNEIDEISKEVYKDKEIVELSKTGIEKVDDMLEFMKDECKENNIDFELQLQGNIHHITNNLITEDELQILLADHIKDAIIAINHTDNVNRSILVKLGKIDDSYGLYIYDSGIEFTEEVLEKLGKEPITTHKDEGGTGMGFMNTFDTLNKHKASLIIKQYGKPSKDNYTKVLMFKFDNKGEFSIINEELIEAK